MESINTIISTLIWYYDFLSEKLSYSFLWNSLFDYLLSLIILLVIVIFVRTIKKVVIKKIKLITDRTSSSFDDFILRIIENIPSYFYWVINLYFPLMILNLPSIVDKVVWWIFIVAIFIQLMSFARKVIEYWLYKYMIERKWDEWDRTTYNLALIIAKIVVYVSWLMLILTNLWFQITPLIASLWVAWLAVWFALQNILADIFSSISIYLDKPFRIWDFIVVWSDNWVVKKIWIKTTRIKTLSWQELVISNWELTSTRINNYWLMEERRIVFKIWVVYETPAEKLEIIPKYIEEIISSQDNTRFDRSHFASFWDFSLDYETVYYVTVPDYNEYMNIQQKINLWLVRKFQEESIEFAYPTQVEYIRSQK